MSSIWAMGCMFMIVCVLSDLTWTHLIGGGKKSWYIIVIMPLRIKIDLFLIESQF